MKKSIAILLALTMLLALCACGGTSSNTPEPTPEPTQDWIKDYYLDEFKTPTEIFYLGTGFRVTGSYSSGTVNEGKLEAELRLDEGSIRIYLYENGSEPVKNAERAEVLCPVLIRTPDGSTIRKTGLLAGGADCVLIPEEQRWNVLSASGGPSKEAIAPALCGEGEVSFYISREDQPATSYLFTVNCGNFAELYDAEIALPIRAEAYADAEALLAAEDYDGALAAFTALGDYRDSAERARQIGAERDALREKSPASETATPLPVPHLSDVDVASIPLRDWPDIDITLPQYTMVSSSNLLPSSYEPELAVIEGSDMMFDAAALPHLEALIRDLQDHGFGVYVGGAYRSYSYQKQRFDGKCYNIALEMGIEGKEIWLLPEYQKAVEEAKKYTMEPGASEHQLGLAVDLYDKQYVAQNYDHMNQRFYEYLDSICADYGFIKRYPTRKLLLTGWDEPWHYRYVGVEAATFIMNNKLCYEEFYAHYVPDFDY